jgi:hypothetical protein
MVTHDSTSASPTPQMRPEEMRGLAKRLRARADSALMRDQQHQQSDMRTAASLIERLLHLLTEIHTAADSTEDGATERHLREMLGGQ